MAEENDVLDTAWTLIRQGQQAAPGGETRHRCLEYLASTYREPVKKLVRAWGVRDEATIEDRVQEYFTKFLEKDWLDDLDESRGSFRGFLRVSVRNFLLKQHEHDARRPRQVSIDASSTSTSEVHHELPSAQSTPDEEYDREWARSLMREAIALFKAECDENKLPHYWQVFDRHLLNADQYGSPSYKETAAALGLREGDVANYLHRSRERFAGVVRRLVRRTVASEAEVEEELEALSRYFE